MNTVSKELELPGAFILGAAAAPNRIVGMNAEVNCLPSNSKCFTQQMTSAVIIILKGQFGTAAVSGMNVLVHS